MKKATIVLALLLVLVFSISNHRSLLPQRAFAQVPTLTIEGDLFIIGEERKFENEVVEIDGSIIVQAEGTLFLKNTTLIIVQTSSMQHNITVIGSNLNAIDSGITSKYFFHVYFEADSSLTASSFNAGPSRFFFRDQTKATMINTEVGFIRASNSTVVIAEDSKINPSIRELSSAIAALEAYGMSSITLSQTSLREANFYDNSLGLFSDATIFAQQKPISLHNTSRLIVENSEGKWHIETHDSSSALIRRTTLESIKTYGFSITSIWDVVIKNGLISYDSSNVLLIDSEIAAQTSFEQYLVTYGSSSVSLFGSEIKGLLSTQDTSFVRADASNINWLNAHGSSKLELYDSKFPAMYLHDSSQIYISDSNISLMHTYDSSQVSMSDSMATIMHLHDSSTVSIQDSQINHTYIYAKNIEGSFHDTKPSPYIDRWNSFSDASIIVHSEGYAPDITLERTEISDDVSLVLSGSSNITLTSSTITHLEVSDTTTAHLLNTTVSFYDVADQATIYVYWYLKVHAPRDATVMVSYYNGTTQATVNTDDSGLASSTVLEKRIVSTGTFEMEKYLVDVTSPDYSQNQWIKMTGNMELFLTPPIPWWQQYWYVILLSAAIVVIAVVLWKLKARKQRVLKSLKTEGLTQGKNH